MSLRMCVCMSVAMHYKQISVCLVTIKCVSYCSCEETQEWSLHVGLYKWMAVKTMSPTNICLTWTFLKNKTSQNHVTRDFGSIWATGLPVCRPLVCPALLVPLAACTCRAPAARNRLSIQATPVLRHRDSPIWIYRCYTNPWLLQFTCLIVKKVKASHTCYRALCPELSWSWCTCSQPAGDYKSSASARLPLLSARPAVTFPAAEHHRPLAQVWTTCTRLFRTFCPE